MAGESRHGRSWLDALPNGVGVLIGIVLSRMGVFDPVWQAVGGWLGLGGRGAREPGPSAAMTASPAGTTDPDRAGIGPHDVRAPVTPDRREATRER